MLSIGSIDRRGLAMVHRILMGERRQAMHAPRTRREFLTSVGQGTLVATVGVTLARDLGLSRALGSEPPEALAFGALEPLVVLMQETPIEKLLPTLVQRLQG